MIIRQERIEDYKEVYKLVKAAFETAEMSDGTEQDLVTALRNTEDFIPELSLVALDNKKIIGHIMFTKVYVGGVEELALAPLSVHPNYQKQGVGKTLIAEGHKIAASMGYEYSIVLGSEKYYPKFGYVPAETFGIQAPFDVPLENYMAISLKENPIPVSGIVVYSKAFGI